MSLWETILTENTIVRELYHGIWYGHMVGGLWKLWLSDLSQSGLGLDSVWWG